MSWVFRRNCCQLALLLLLAALSGRVFAAGEEMTMPTDPGVLPSNGNDYRIGIGALSTPAFVGSTAQRKLLSPVFSANIDGTFYIGSSYTGVGGGIGLFLHKSQSFIWTLGIAGAQGRAEDWAPELQGMGDQHATLFLNSGMSWRVWAFHISGGIATGLRRDEGSLARVEAGMSGPVNDKWLAGIGADVVVANGQENTFEYGVSPAQALARSALIASGTSDLRPGEAGPFTAAGGTQRTGYGAFVAYVFDRHWSLAGFWGQAQLHGSVENSPLVRSRTGPSYGLFLSYKFSSTDGD